jgi:hypothetical protein
MPFCPMYDPAATNNDILQYLVTNADVLGIDATRIGFVGNDVAGVPVSSSLLAETCQVSQDLSGLTGQTPRVSDSGMNPEGPSAGP